MSDTVTILKKKMYIKVLLLFFAPGFIVIGDSHDQWRVMTGKFKFSE